MAARKLSAGPEQTTRSTHDMRFPASLRTGRTEAPARTQPLFTLLALAFTCTTLLAQTTERVSVSSSGVQGNNYSAAGVLTPDGRFVAFCSEATNLVAGDTNGASDIFLRDRLNGTTERVSVATGGAQANGGSSSYLAAISADGRCVAFHATANDLVPGDSNGFWDVFLRDRLAGTPERVSVSTAGGQGNGDSDVCSVSTDGRFVAFKSGASNLVSGDTNGLQDVFVRDRNAAGFTSLCDPGSGGVSACPCSNPPSGAGRGCDNSSSSGGAVLSASGSACLATDSLVFSTTGENPAATSILLQGDALLPAGLVFGQGVRCAGGTLKRMYAKTAVSGSISAPDFGAGDPTVSARSAQLGFSIQPRQPCYYLVYYRDPAVLGGCPATSTFNATQTGSVTYWP
jgi:hypothetical protein